MTATVALAPARQAALVAGASGLVVDVAAITAVLALVSVSPGTALAFVVNVLVSGTVSGALSRRSLRRGLRPAADSVRIPVGRLLGAVITAVVVVRLSVSPAVLGAGVGANLALLWRARQISGLEGASAVARYSTEGPR